MGPLAVRPSGRLSAAARRRQGPAGTSRSLGREFRRLDRDSAEPAPSRRTRSMTSMLPPHCPPQPGRLSWSVPCASLPVVRRSSVGPCCFVVSVMQTAGRSKSDYRVIKACTSPIIRVRNVRCLNSSDKFTNFRASDSGDWRRSPSCWGAEFV